MYPQTNQQRLQQTQNLLAQSQPPPPDALANQGLSLPNISSMQNLASSQKQLGNALQAYQNQQNNPQGFSQGQGGQNSLQNWAGLCEAWAEKQAFGKTGLFPSAIDAANHFARNGQLNPNIQNAPAGSLIYFNADNSNGGFGHVAMADGRGNITGATYGGVKTMPLNQWLVSTKQQPLGFVATKR